MSLQAREAYLESKVLSADPLELVRIMYQAALEAVAQARRCLAENDVFGRSREISKAHGLLTELALSLNHEAGGELSRNLAELYEYMQRRLLEAHIQKSDAALAEVARLLATLLEGWNQCRPGDQARQIEPQLACLEPASEYAAQSWSA